MWSPALPELDHCPGKAVDLNGDIFYGKYAYILPIVEVYSDKPATDVR